jgi:trk system potassium uptake protein TrkH
VLCVAILPFLGVGGMQIFRAEMPGPSKDRLTPRIATTAKLFWGVYSLLSLLLFLFLWVGKMDWYESLNHVFTTMATGGFSTRSGSIGAYDSPYIEWVLVVFMLLAGTNFTLHYAALTGRGKPYWRNSEFGTYIILWAAASIFIALSVWHGEYSAFSDALRSACFQCASIMTTTGFATADFDQWSNACRLLLLILMFIGGCAGSTGGGIKVVRIMVIFKKAGREIRRFLQPNAVIALRLGNKPLDQNAVSHISAFFVLFMLLFAFFSFIMTFFTPDLETAYSSVVATMANIGPGLSEVGPAETYASIDSPGLVILTLCMLLGRLELYTVLIALLPHFWRNT